MDVVEVARHFFSPDGNYWVVAGMLPKRIWITCSGVQVNSFEPRVSIACLVKRGGFFVCAPGILNRWWQLFQHLLIDDNYLKEWFWFEYGILVFFKHAIETLCQYINIKGGFCEIFKAPMTNFLSLEFSHFFTVRISFLPTIRIIKTWYFSIQIK